MLNWLTDAVARAAGLSMLWESIDPATALRDRFGLDDAGHAALFLAEVISSGWGRRMQRCDGLVISASNLLAWLTVEGENFIAKCSVDQARFARLAQADALVAWLDFKRIPVASPIAASDGRLRIERDRFSIGLYPVIAGDLLDVGDAGQVEAAGRALATLHEALAAYPLRFGDDQSEPNQQLVHDDFRSANVLQVDGTIAAVLDFDEVNFGSRIADLAKAAVLLGTRYHEWRPTSPQMQAAFVKAYSSVAPLTDQQRDQLDHSMTKVLSHFGWT